MFAWYYTEQQLKKKNHSSCRWFETHADNLKSVMRHQTIIQHNADLFITNKAFEKKSKLLIFSF